MSDAFLGQGTLLQKDTGGGSYRTIAACKSITGPSYEADEVDITSHDSTAGFRTFIRGLIDPGEISAECVFDPNDVTHGLSGVLGDLQAGTPEPYKIKWVEAAMQLTFIAFVKSFPITSPVDAELTATVTLRVTGDITLETAT